MAKKHIHKYHRITMYGTPIWACALPNCNHYMPKHMEQMVEGKASICWECGKEMILDSANMMIDRPICITCKNPISEVKLDLSDKFQNSSNEAEKDDIARRLASILSDN